MCPMCPRTFSSVDELGHHIPIHTFDKLYRCQQCLYRTDSRSNLLRHLRTHTGEKRHACPVCPYRAGQKSDLRRHLRVHALKQFNNVFRCRLCDASSPSAIAFARHILDSHSGGGQGGEGGDDDPPQDSIDDPTASSQDPPAPPRPQEAQGSETRSQDTQGGPASPVPSQSFIEDPTEDPLEDS